MDEETAPYGREQGEGAGTHTEAALRALAEAQERRAARAGSAAAAAPEVGGRGGLDPVRYGDWETKGIASDF